MNPSKLLLALTASLLLTACGGKEEAAQPAPETAAAPTAEAVAAAEQVAQSAPAEGTDAATMYTRRCVSCHGDLAQGVAGNPALDKLSAADIKAKLTKYRAGETLGPKSAIMAPITQNLSDADIDALASYLGS